MDDENAPAVEDRPRGEVITTSPQAGDFAEPQNYSPRTNAEIGSRGVNLGNPGRLGRTAATEGERSWESKEFVSARHSATGEPYQRGQAIPLAEAVRQGLANPDGSEVVPRRSRMRIPKELCPKCRGARRGHGRNHKPDCTCTICSTVCKTCKGTGYVEKKGAA